MGLIRTQKQLFHTVYSHLASFNTWHLTSQRACYMHVDLACVSAQPWCCMAKLSKPRVIKSVSVETGLTGLAAMYDSACVLHVNTMPTHLPHSTFCASTKHILIQNRLYQLIHPHKVTQMSDIHAYHQKMVTYSHLLPVRITFKPPK